MNINISEIPKIRVSTAGFAVLKDTNGYFALTLNPKRPVKVFTPIGGGLEVTDNGIEDLKKLLDIESGVFEEGNGLRFEMPGSVAGKYREWFLSGVNRDKDPHREVFEELVDELGLLSKVDLEDVYFEKLGYGVELSEGTQRIGADGSKPTLRLLEIFEMRVKPETLQKLAELSKSEDSHIRFVTKDEIKRRVTEDGIKIATNVARFLFDYQSEIVEFK